MDPKTKTEQPTKNLSAFVRSQPSDVSHKDVVAQGKSQGLKLTEAYVARVRNRAAHAAGAGKTKPNAAPKPSKSEFVRAHPKLPATEIVARAKDAGMVFTSSYVNQVRSGDRKRSRRPRKIKVEAVARLETRESAPVKRKPGRPKTLAGPAFAESLAVPAAARPTRDAPARERAITLVPSRAPSTVLRHGHATSPSLENTLRAVIGELGLQRALLIFEEEHERVRALTET